MRARLGPLPPVTVPDGKTLLLVRRLWAMSVVSSMVLTSTAGVIYVFFSIRLWFYWGLFDDDLCPGCGCGEQEGKGEERLAEGNC